MSADTQADLTERARQLLSDLEEGYIAYCGDRFSQRVRSREDAQKIVAAALQSEREAAKAEAREEIAQLRTELQYHRHWHRVAREEQRASPPAPQEETR